MLKGKFKFHPVGQGGFYTGKISYKKKQFNIVYDCGNMSSKSYLSKSIREYKKHDLCGEKIDILILSHLDNDHINGVSKLLNGISCNICYMPYLTPFERLLLAIMQQKRNKAYLEFLKSPHTFFKKNISKIIYIIGNAETDFIQESIIAGVKENEKQDEDELLINLKARSLKNNFKEVEENEHIRLYGLEGDFDDNSMFKQGNGLIQLGSIWDFYIYNDRIDHKTLNELFTELKKTIKTIFNIDINNEMTQKQLIDILDDKKNFKELKKSFFSNKINISSLVLMHQPLNFQSGKIIRPVSASLGNNNSTPSNLNNSPNSSFGLTLLTGDITIKQLDSSDYIKNKLKQIDIFQVPHHGSITGWDKTKLKLLKNDNSTSTILNVENKNISPPNKHPDKQVVSDLNNEHFDIFYCTETDSFTYTFNLNYK